MDQQPEPRCPVDEAPQEPGYPRRHLRRPWLSGSVLGLSGLLLLGGALWLAENEWRPPPSSVDFVYSSTRTAGVGYVLEPPAVADEEIPERPYWRLDWVARSVNLEAVIDGSDLRHGGGVTRTGSPWLVVRRPTEGALTLLPAMLLGALAALGLGLLRRRGKVAWARRLGSSSSRALAPDGGPRWTTLSGRLRCRGKPTSRFEDGEGAAVATATTGHQGASVSQRAEALTLEVDSGESVTLQGPIEVILSTREVGPLPSVERLDPEAQDRLTAADEGALTLLAGRRLRLLSTPLGEAVQISGRLRLSAGHEGVLDYRASAGRWELLGTAAAPLLLTTLKTPRIKRWSLSLLGALAGTILWAAGAITLGGLAFGL